MKGVKTPYLKTNHREITPCLKVELTAYTTVYKLNALVGVLVYMNCTYDKKPLIFIKIGCTKTYDLCQSCIGLSCHPTPNGS